MNFVNRSYRKELLDADDIPFEHIKQNMQELNTINTWLGGHKITISGLKELISGRKQIDVCEIGCGGGDNLLALWKWCRRNNIEITFIGIDIKPSCIYFAKTREQIRQSTTWLVNNYQKIAFEIKPDIIFSSLFCHHFTENELVHQLRWMMANCNTGYFINDLQRNWLSYYAIKILTKLFSASYLVKNDAPLSVARGFKRKDWENILCKAGIENYQIKWKWAFRYLITVKKCNIQPYTI